MLSTATAFFQFTYLLIYPRSTPRKEDDAYTENKTEENLYPNTDECQELIS